MGQWVSILGGLALLTILPAPMANLMAREARQGEVRKPAQDAYLPVDVTCPTGNDGSLVALFRNPEGNSRRLVIRFRDGVAVAFSLGISLSGEGFVQGLLADLDRDPSPSTKAVLEKVTLRYRDLIEKACLGETP